LKRRQKICLNLLIKKKRMMCELVGPSPDRGGNPARPQASPPAAVLPQSCGDPRALLPPAVRPRSSRLTPAGRHRKEKMPATAPGTLLNAPAALVGVVCGLHMHSGSVPPGPPAASCPPEGLLCDAAVVFEGLGSLSMSPSTPANSAAALASAVLASRRADPTVGGSLAHSIVHMKKHMT
jgi:hypothetical protein